MPPDLPYQIPLAGIALIIVLYFLIRAWTYGIVRPVFTALSFAAGTVVAYLAYRKAEQGLIFLKFEPEPITTFAFGFLAGLAVFLLLRKTGHKLFDALFSPETFMGRFLAGPLGAALSLIPTLLIIAVLATGLRIYATFAELRHIDTCGSLYSSGETDYPATPYPINLRNAFERIPHAAHLLDRFDPYSRKTRRNLAALALISRHYDLYLRLEHHRLAVEIYTQPKVAAMLRALEITVPLDENNFRAVLTAPLLRETAAVPEIVDKLNYLDIIDVLHHALGVQ